MYEMQLFKNNQAIVLLYKIFIPASASFIKPLYYMFYF